MSETAVPLAPEDSSDSDQPSLFWRWLGSVPLFASILVVGWTSLRGGRLAEIFEQLKVDLPLFSLWALSWFKIFPTLFWGWIPFSTLLCWIYFVWGTKTRNRLLAFNVTVFLLLLAATIVLLGGIVLPLVKINEALRATS